MLLYFQYVWVEALNILAVTEDESLLWVESESDNVFDIAKTHLDGVFKEEFLLVDVLFVVCDLDDKRNIKHSLQVLREMKGIV